MSAAKYTPGPWFGVGEDDEDGEHVTTIWANGGHQIAVIHGRGSAFANADLIRAAPELLAMLQKIRDYHVNHHVLYEIDAVIAKATGRTA